MSEQFADTLQDYIDAFGNTAPINPRGAYDDEEEYVPRDAVAYTAGGKTLTYINKQACTGIAPTDPDEGAAHWQIMIDVSVGGSFSALSDVSVDPQTLADGQMPVYNATGQVWENKTVLENSLTSTATDKALTAAKGKELQDNKQDKELETPITVAGVSKTTVESALDGINDYVDDSVEALANVYGAKNLIPFPYYEASSFTSNGVTFTVNADKSISLSGTATADTFYQLDTHIFADMYVGLNVTASIEGCIYGVTFFGQRDAVTVFETASDTTFTVPSYSGYFGLYIRVYSGIVTDGVTVYPMICDARIRDLTYAPPTKTNKQLTEIIQEEDISSQVSVNTTYFNPGVLITYKKMCNGLKWLFIYGQPITTAPHDTALMSGFTPQGIHKVCPVYNMVSQTTRFVRIWIDGYGQLMIDDNLSTTDMIIYNDIIR